MSDRPSRHPSPELAARIKAEHARAVAAAPLGLEHARAAGELLLQARGQCARGSWTKWLRDDLAVPARRAQDYMRLARHWSALQANGRRPEALSLHDALLLLMGLPSTPVRAARPRRRD
jgi:hypothetical protein